MSLNFLSHPSKLIGKYSSTSFYFHLKEAGCRTVIPYDNNRNKQTKIPIGIDEDVI